MRNFTIFSFLFALLTGHAPAQAETWQPAAGQLQVPIWPGAVPDAISNPKAESVGPMAGHGGWTQATDVSQPTMTVFAAKGQNSGAAVVVFPGGGFKVLAMDLEGTEICDWLTSRGITCVLLKYRVPKGNHHWDEKWPVLNYTQGSARAAGCAEDHQAGAVPGKRTEHQSRQDWRDRLLGGRLSGCADQQRFRANL